MILGIVDYNWYLILVSDKQWVRYSTSTSTWFHTCKYKSSFNALIKIRDLTYIVGDSIMNQRKLTFNNLIIHSLLNSHHKIKLFFSFLESFRVWFYSSVPIKHVEDPILFVSDVPKVKDFTDFWDQIINHRG